MTDNRTIELLRKLRKMLDRCRRTEMAGFDTYWITAVALDSSLDELEQAVSSTLQSDEEYESKMDALLSRLTNGKWSKSRVYDLDFMVSCVDEEYEDAYEKERATMIAQVLTGGEAMTDETTEKKPAAEAKGDCTICNGWVDDGRGGTCVFTGDFWTPCCLYDKEAKQ